MTSSQIQILNYEKVNKNKVIGYVDIRIPKWGVTLRRIAHLQSGDKSWFNFPMFSQEQANDKLKFTPYISFDQPMHSSEFFKTISDLVDDFLSKGPISETIPF